MSTLTTEEVVLEKSNNVLDNIEEKTVSVSLDTTPAYDDDTIMMLWERRERMYCFR